MSKNLINVISGIFLLVVVINYSGLQAQERLNAFDENGKRTGVWKKYYNNNRLRYQGQFEAGEETGVFKFYSALNSDHPVAIKTYDKGSPLVKVSFYSVDGALESEGDMKNKEREGKWCYYHKDGKIIIAEENYLNGLLDGVSKTFYKNGKITEIMHYKAGKLHGTLKRFAQEGGLLDDLIYVEGKLNGLAKYYNAKGELIYTGTYKNDEKVGKWEFFENGEPGDVNKFKQ